MNSPEGPARGEPVARRQFLIGSALALASGVALARQPQASTPRVSREEFEKWVPNKVGSWSAAGASGVLLPPPDALSDRLYDNLVTASYTSASEPTVMMLVAYNNMQDGVVQVHRPEICYPVGGYQLSETRGFMVRAGTQLIPAKIFTAAGPDRTEQVVYFTRLGSAFPRTWVEQRMAVAKANLAGQIPDGLLMRVSLLGPSQPNAETVLARFLNEFTRDAAPPLRNLLLGTPAKA